MLHRITLYELMSNYSKTLIVSGGSKETMTDIQALPNIQINESSQLPFKRPIFYNATMLNGNIGV